ncbi:MAG: rhodanese-like domain-containing protein [Haloferacaceae archaeon]
MVEEIPPEAVRERIGDEDCQIVDIRPRDQFEAGHIPGAINIPMTELPDHIDEVEWADDVTVVCPVGQSSVQAAKLIGSYEGADADAVKSMAGGYREWEYELESGGTGADAEVDDGDGSGTDPGSA